MTADRTACASCGRDTRTSTDGFCAECWQDKTAAGRAAFQTPPRTHGILDGLDLDAAWWWIGAVAVVLVPLLVARLLL